MTETDEYENLGSYSRDKNNKDKFSDLQTTFLEVCKKIDKVAEHNNSKNRKHTYESVLKKYLEE